MITEDPWVLSWVEAKEQSKRMAEIPSFQQPQMGQLHLMMKAYTYLSTEKILCIPSYLIKMTISGMLF